MSYSSAPRVRSWFVGCLILGLALVPLGSLHATSMLDQSFDPSGHVTMNAGLSDINTNQQRAQTFQVGTTGELTQVNVFIERFADQTTTGNLLLDIRTTTPSGTPDNSATALLASTSIPASRAPANPPSNGGFVAFDLSSFNIHVTQGEELAIVLHVGSGVPVIGWLGQTDNPYTNGSSFEQVIGNHEWVGDPTGGDLGFQDFVDSGVAAVPEPSSLVLLASAGIGLLGYGWRRRKGIKPALS